MCKNDDEKIKRIKVKEGIDRICKFDMIKLLFRPVKYCSSFPNAAKISSKKTMASTRFFKPE